MAGRPKRRAGLTGGAHPSTIKEAAPKPVSVDVRNPITGSCERVDRASVRDVEEPLSWEELERLIDIRVRTVVQAQLEGKPTLTTFDMLSRVETYLSRRAARKIQEHEERALSSGASGGGLRVLDLTRLFIRDGSDSDSQPSA